MKRICLLLGLILLLPMEALYAQTLKKGTWVGQVMVPSGKIDTLYMHVEPAVDGLKIDIELKDVGRFPGEAVRHEEHAMYFTWNYNVAIDCVLYPQENGSYQGSCTDEKGNKGRFAFVPSHMADSPHAQQIFDDWAYFWKGRM